MIELCLGGRAARRRQLRRRARRPLPARGSSRRSRAPVAAPTGPQGARRDLSSLPDLRVALETNGTFLGMSDELLLDRVRTQPIARFKLNHGGSSLSFRVEFADGSRAAWKPMQTNMQSVPRKEVAAYRLNRLLGLHAVPPAAPRAVTREELLEHLHPESLAVPAAHQGRDRVRPRRQDDRHGVVLDPDHQGLRLRHARRPQADAGVADAWAADPGRSPVDGGAGVDADRVRLPDVEPGPLLGRQHEDVGRRQAALLHGQHHVVLRRRQRQRAQPRGAVQDAAVLARAVRGARQGDGREHAARARRGAGHALRDPDAGRDRGGGLAPRRRSALHRRSHRPARREATSSSSSRRRARATNRRAAESSREPSRGPRLSREHETHRRLWSRPRWPPVSPVELPKPMRRASAARPAARPTETRTDGSSRAAPPATRTSSSCTSWPSTSPRGPAPSART